MQRVRRFHAALLGLVCCVSLGGCLNDPFLLQPELQIEPGAPAGWSINTSTAAIGVTTTDVKEGAKALYLSSAFVNGIGNFTISQTFIADDYRGRRLRLTAWVKPRNIGTFNVSGLFMRVEGWGTLLQFDNMISRPISGSGNWRQVQIVVDVPTTAVGITIGAQFQGTNTLLIDDLRLDIVGNDVASTNRILQPVATDTDSAGIAVRYARRPRAPINLAFEGVAAVDVATTTFLQQQATLLTTTDPTAATTDLDAARARVDAARIHGLGVAANGTRELLRLRDRVTRWLVRDLGARLLILDAPAAEAALLDRWLTTGVGDPAALLRGLHVTSWRTQETLDALVWLREWNRTAPSGARVTLRGVDPRYAGSAIDSVVAFVSRRDASLAADIRERYSCIDAYRNRGATPGQPLSIYANSNGDLRTRCAEALADAVTVVERVGVAAPEYAEMRQLAVVVQQFEFIARQSVAANQTRARYESMASSVEWARSQSGGAARTVLWMDAAQLSRRPATFGTLMRTFAGESYQPWLFLAGSGQTLAAPTGETELATLAAFAFELTPRRSLEEAFTSTARPLLLLDALRIASGGPSAAWLIGPIQARVFPAVWPNGGETVAFGEYLLPNDVDFLAWARTSAAATPLN
jgi:erythromycin esterase-like protein